MFNYDHKPTRFWPKFNHPTIGERQKNPLSSHEHPLMPKALLLLFISKYSKLILFIALSFSSTMKLQTLFF